MTRPEALLVLLDVARGLPAGTVEERAAKAAERVAARDDAPELRAALVELALAQLVAQAGGGR
jgi:hypothetical protein